MTIERLYFAYGSNMSSARLRARIPDAQSIGRAHWPGMRLAFNKVGVDGSGKANLIADPGSVAWGVLFKIPDDAWANLDAFEPGYTRSTCSLVSDDHRSTEAEVYLANGPFVETAPHDWYREHLRIGALEHALPSDIVRFIEQL